MNQISPISCAEFQDKLPDLFASGNGDVLDFSAADSSSG